MTHQDESTPQFHGLNPAHDFQSEVYAMVWTRLIPQPEQNRIIMVQSIGMLKSLISYLNILDDVTFSFCPISLYDFGKNSLSVITQ